MDSEGDKIRRLLDGADEQSEYDRLLEEYKKRQRREGGIKKMPYKRDEQSSGPHIKTLPARRSDFDGSQPSIKNM